LHPGLNGFTGLCGFSSSFSGLLGSSFSGLLGSSFSGLLCSSSFSGSFVSTFSLVVLNKNNAAFSFPSTNE